VVEACGEPFHAERGDVELEGIERPARGNCAKRKRSPAVLRFERVGRTVAGLKECGEISDVDGGVRKLTARAARGDRLPERQGRPARRGEVAFRKRKPADCAGHAELKIG
jgi:hypothetical protein